MTVNRSNKRTEHDFIAAQKGADNYERHLEKNAVRIAVGSGYFKALTSDDLLGRSWRTDIRWQEGEDEIPLDEKSKKENAKLENIKILSFNLCKLRTIGPIGLCFNLTICNVSGNYITRIDALQSCKSLVKLDAHQNQIQELPAEVFWSELDNLQIVYLHNNGVTSFEEIKKMCFSQKLWMLTLFDTPVSLKMHYRHFTTNSILSLKVLDNIIISDEEIIEDANFHIRFKALQPQFVIQPKTGESKAHWTILDEFQALQEDLTFVNKVQAKYSPVLIIQRYIRGYLARSRCGYEKEKRLWAAVTIQRFYREYKGLEMPQNQGNIDGLSFASLSSQRIEYDTYIKYRRSRHRSRHSATVLPLLSRPMNNYIPEAKPNFCLSKADDTTLKIHINLKELETSTSKIIDESLTLDDSVSESRKKPTSRSTKKDSGKASQQKPISVDLVGNFTSNNLMQLDREMRQKEKQNLIKQATDKCGNGENGELKDEDGMVPFRLSGIRAPKVSGDLLEELTRDIVYGARDIRNSIKAFENSMHRRAPPVIERHYPITNDQKLYIRTRGTIALSCFRAVDQAYKDRDRTKSMLAKMSQVRSMKEKRELSSRVRNHNKYSSIRSIHSEKNHAAAELSQVMDDYKAEVEERQELVSAERNERLKRGKQRRKDRAFAVEFVCQNNAISKALVSHASTAAKEKVIQVKVDNACNIRKDMHRQKEIIKRYTEHRNLLLQSEVSLSRSKLDSDLMIRSLEQEKEARLQVKKLKNQKDLNKDVSTPCLVTVPNRLPPLAVIADGQLDAWEKLPKKEFKAREHDRFDNWLS